MSTFYMPTRLFAEENAVIRHAGDLASFGKKALIVTGRHSAFSNGSYEDTTTALENAGIGHVLFSEVEENPSVATIMKARDFGLANSVDFVIGIGGGSPLDASKAISLMIAMADKDKSYLYSPDCPGKTLPIVAIPTTCGTGSEVTAVSVITDRDKMVKKSIAHKIFPDLALVDGRYLAGAPLSQTIYGMIRATKDERAAGKTHKVILMLDVGDRREGVTTVEDLAALASEVKRTMPHLEVAGVGTNYGCVSGVLPDDANLQMLCDGAEAVESVLGHPLEIVSGGSSSSLIRSWKGLPMPAKIDHLRIGGAIANPNNIMINRGIEIPGANIDTFRLKVQIAECKEDPFNLLPVDPDVHVIAGSSDHTVLDVTDCKEKVNVGDVLEFRLRYGGLLQIFSTKHVKIQFR